MRKKYPFYFIAILILVLSFGVMVKRAISDVAVNNLRAEFINALRDGDCERVVTYVDPEKQKVVEDSLRQLSKKDLSTLADLFAAGKLVEQTPTKRTYQTNGMIDGIAVDAEYTINLDQNGQWFFATDSSPYLL